ncbi:hypothetical protein KCV00_g172, partial [Aureobasidium melanogenum]
MEVDRVAASDDKRASLQLLLRMTADTPSLTHAMLYIISRSSIFVDVTESKGFDATGRRVPYQQSDYR